MVVKPEFDGFKAFRLLLTQNLYSKFVKCL